MARSLKLKTGNELLHSILCDSCLADFRRELVRTEGIGLNEPMKS
jgi:hypothetical protein